MTNLNNKELNINIPEACPSCGSQLKKTGVHLVCPSATCPEMNIQKITFWVKACELDGVSEQTIRTLYEQGLIKKVADLYTLTEKQVMALPGFQKSKASNLIKQIAKSKKMTFPQFVARLGIPLVGEKAVKKLNIKNIKDFCNFDDRYFTIGSNLIDFRNENGSYIVELLGMVEIEDEIEVDAKGRVCMTGTGPKGRKELIKDIEEKGYIFVDSITKDTNILLCEDVNGDSSKLQKARKLGIQLMSYGEFFA